MEELDHREPFKSPEKSLMASFVGRDAKEREICTLLRPGIRMCQYSSASWFLCPSTLSLSTALRECTATLGLMADFLQPRWAMLKRLPSVLPSVPSVDVMLKQKGGKGQICER